MIKLFFILNIFFAVIAIAEEESLEDLKGAMQSFESLLHDHALFSGRSCFEHYSVFVSKLAKMSEIKTPGIMPADWSLSEECQSDLVEDLGCDFYPKCAENFLHCESIKPDNYLGKYPIRFGYHFCSVFKNLHNNGVKKEVSKKWIRNTLTCLKRKFLGKMEEMISLIKKSPVTTETCDYGIFANLKYLSLSSGEIFDQKPTSWISSGPNSFTFNCRKNTDFYRFDAERMCLEIEDYEFAVHEECYTKQGLSICELAFNAPTDVASIIIETEPIPQLLAGWKSFKRFLNQVKEVSLTCFDQISADLHDGGKKSLNNLINNKSKLALTSQEIDKRKENLNKVIDFLDNKIKEVDQKILEEEKNQRGSSSSNIYYPPRTFIYPNFNQPSGELRLAAGQVYYIDEDTTLSLDLLVMEEGSSIVIRHGAQLNIEAKNARFGKNTKIIGSGENGKSAPATAPATPPGAPNDRKNPVQGKDGGKGANGTNGIHASHLYLNVGLESDFGGLKIDLKGGNGGNGQPGGDGGFGSNDPCFQTYGGNGGNGGLGAYGANGGNLTLNWWRSGFNSFVKTDAEINNSVSRSQQEGQGGIDAKGGLAGGSKGNQYCELWTTSEDFDRTNPEFRSRAHHNNDPIGTPPHNGEPAKSSQNPSGSPGLFLVTSDDKNGELYLNKIPANVLVEMAAHPQYNDWFYQYYKDERIDLGVELDNGENVLMATTTDDNLDLFNFILQNGGDGLQSKVDKNNENLMDYAMKNKSYKIILKLVEMGYKIDGHEKYAQPLIEALLRMDEGNEILEKFVSKNILGIANYLAMDSKYNKKFLSLYEKGFIQKDSTNSDGESLMMSTTYSDNKVIFDLLLSNNADLSLRDKRGEDIFDHALKKNSFEAVKSLLNAGKDVSPKNKYSKHFFESAVKVNNDDSLLQSLLDVKFMDTIICDEKNKK